MSESLSFLTPLTSDWLSEQAVLSQCRFETGLSLAEPTLLPEELQHAHPKRQCEYLAGRWCAQQGMQALQPALAEQSLPRGADGAPGWPPMLVGSITHSHGQAAALVASRAHYLSVGLDREPLIPVLRASKLEAKLLRAEESQQLDALALSAEQRALWISRIFSAKEALFKALFPLTGVRFYFQDAGFTDLVHNPGRITLARTLSSRWCAGTGLDCYWETESSAVLTWILVPAVTPVSA